MTREQIVPSLGKKVKVHLPRYFNDDVVMIFYGYQLIYPDGKMIHQGLCKDKSGAVYAVRLSDVEVIE